MIKIVYAHDVSRSKLLKYAEEVFPNWEVDAAMIADAAVEDILQMNADGLVALHDGRCVGICSYTVQRDMEYITIDEIASSREVSGIGTAMFKSIANLAAKWNKGIELYSYEGEYGFYESLGMKYVRTINDLAYFIMSPAMIKSYTGVKKYA